ncbi:MAG: hypothetical protein AB1422_16060 [bacterium]
MEREGFMTHKALALLSGGLDSTIAIEIILKMGIEVEAINFISPFWRWNQIKDYSHSAEIVTEKCGMKLKVFELGKEYLEMLKNPKYGYGKNINPCIDCRILMLKKAKEYMTISEASFIVTGEVLGQRPMSQYRRAMEIIDRESGLEGLVLRPLSAKLLKPTLPEEKGWVDREKLLSISGRSRKPQIQLAKELQINDYPSPAGGCLLTDPEFAKKMKDLLTHTDAPTLIDIEFLKIGRHFRLSEELKVVVGRNEEENERLLELGKDDVQVMVVNYKGPIVICRGQIEPDNLLKAAAICARYSDDKGKSGIRVIWDSHKEEILNVCPIDEVEIEGLRI